jgi:hypothetical protein
MDVLDGVEPFSRGGANYLSRFRITELAGLLTPFQGKRGLPAIGFDRRATDACEGLAIGLSGARPIGSIETVNEGDVIHEVGTCCSLCGLRLRRRGVFRRASQRSESLADVQ